MSATTYGWLVLAFPLAGLLVISLGWRVLPGTSPAGSRSAAIGLSFLASIGAAGRAAGPARGQRASS